jgi:apolipoprotein D and lipocalin family protein
MGQNPTKAQVSTQTLTTFDVSKYVGGWYDIAHLPDSYQTKCGNSIAFYIAEENGLFIANYCLSEGKVKKHIEGHATVPDPTQPAKLEVSFNSAIGSTKGNYWIYDTDYTSYSIVGSGDGYGFWILSRTPTMSIGTYTRLVTKMRSLGYNPTDLIIGPLVLTK